VTDPAAFVLLEIRVALIGGDQEPGFVLVEGAEGKAGVEVKRFTQHRIAGAGSRTDVDVSYVQAHVDAQLHGFEGLFGGRWS